MLLLVLFAAPISAAGSTTTLSNATVSLKTSFVSPPEMAAFVGQPPGTTVHLIIDVNGYFQ
jgi:hypothetical protein